VDNILLVDDVEVNRQLITFNLEQTGAKVNIAVNGLKGLQKALKVQYDLILMDIQMLVMNGKEAMSSLLQLEIKTPVYALTADCTSSDVQRYAATGFTGALDKPLALETLCSVTSQHLSVCDVEAGTTAQQAPLLIPSSKIRILFYKE
jgi:CheY-like chemotaxis protein